MVKPSMRKGVLLFELSTIGMYKYVMTGFTNSNISQEINECVGANYLDMTSVKDGINKQNTSNCVRH